MLVLYHLIPVLCLLCYFAAAYGYSFQFRARQDLGASDGGKGIKSEQVKADLGIRVQRDLESSRKWLTRGFALHLAFFGLEEFIRLTKSGEVDASGRLFGELLIPSFPTTLSLICAALVGVFLIIEKPMKVSVLGAILAPLAAVMMFCYSLLVHFPRPERPEIENSFLLWFHIALTIFGHVAFMLAFATSVCLILQESMLKRKRFNNVQRKLPSLLALDRLNSRFLWSGFVMMATGVIIGAYFAFIRNIPLSLDSRILWSCATLGVYFVLLFMMSLFGIRGRRAAWLSVLGYFTVIGSFVSANLWSTGFHAH